MGKQEDLLAAVRSQDLSAVIKLTGKHNKSKLIGSTKKLNVNQLDSNGLSLLHHAASSDNVDILKILIELGATVDLIDSQGLRPLHIAARQGNSRSIGHLISCGSSINDPAFDGSTPLHMACEHGHLEAVELLLEYQSDSAAYNRDHKTAFDVACEFGHLKIVEKLVFSPSCNALIREYRQKTKDVKRTTCLHLAAKNGHVSVLRHLLEAGFDINRQTTNGTCLHEAILNGQVKVAKLLVDWGINLYNVNSLGQTAADVLHGAPKLFQNEKLVRLLSDAPFQPLTVRATRSHINCQAPNQLTFKEGDLIRVVERRSDETWKGYVFRDADAEQQQQQHVGFFPASVVEIVHSTDLCEEGVSLHHLPTSSLSSFNSSPCPAASSGQGLSPRHHQQCGKLSPVRSSVDSSDRTAQWVVVQSSCDAAADNCYSGNSPMSSKDNISESNRSSTSSSSGSSGYLGSSSGQVNSSGSATYPLHRLSGQSCESGVASLWPSTHCIPVATSRAHQSALDWLLDENGQTGQAGTISVDDLIQKGLKDSEVMYVWLHQLQLSDCYHLFLQAGYDMPTISRMTPEDLTAIGITQPNIRKRLTSEISRLHLQDRIPGFRPTGLLEWLQLLNLEEYHSTLTREGYNSIDRIMEITWEDLEDVGIHKLGHQKKFMLAIDRLTKLNSTTSACPAEHSTGTDLNSSADRSSRLHPTQAKPGEKSREQPMTTSTHVSKSASGDNLSKPTMQSRINETPTKPVAKEIVRLPPQTPYMPQVSSNQRAPTSSRSLTPHKPIAPHSALASHALVVPPAPFAPQTPSAFQPEMIAIQVSRPVGPRTGSMKEKSAEKIDPQHAMCKSFHSNTCPDSSVTVTNDVSISLEARGDWKEDRLWPPVAPAPTSDGQLRRASASVVGGDIAGMNALLQRQSSCGRFYHPEVKKCDAVAAELNVKNRETSQHLMPAGITYSSAPNTPSHSSQMDSSPSRRPKKAVPPPPKRSNSIKDKQGSNGKTGNAKGGPQEMAPPSAVLTSVNTVADETDSTAINPMGVASNSTNIFSNCSTELDNPLTRVIARLEWKDDQVVRPTKTKEFAKTPEKRSAPPSPSSSTSSSYSSNTDCNTLPFANENIGTIKHRNTGKLTTVSGATSDVPNVTSKPPVASKQSVRTRNEAAARDEAVSLAKIPDGKDVFDDIDTLFQGLTQELDHMLTLH